MRLLKYILLFFVVAVVVASCDEAPKNQDNLGKGTIDISVDESYQPVIDEQLRVFDSSYPDAKINIHYKPEAECFKDYFENKARIILVTRPLTKGEKEQCDQQKIYTTSMKLCRDAVAVIVNNSSEDTLLDMNVLKGILTGVYKKKYTVVFDNQASSIVRFVVDSVLKGAKLGANVFAAKGSRDVVDYVAKNPDAIGFVGLNYVSDSTDPNNTGTFINTVKVVAMKNDSTGEFLKPYQAWLALKTYPLYRSLYYINRESYPGLGTGFANFLVAQRGQLIFKFAHMFPVNAEMIVREAQITNHK